MNRLYVYGYNGKVYIGRYGNPKGKPTLTTWVFRTKPLKDGRYCVGKHRLIVKGNCVTLNGPVLHVNMDCYYHDGNSVKRLHDKHPQERTDFRSWFRNTLARFEGQAEMYH